MGNSAVVLYCKTNKKGSDVDLTAVSARTVMCMLIRQMPLAVLLSHLASNQMQKNKKTTYSCTIGQGLAKKMATKRTERKQLR